MKKSLYFDSPLYSFGGIPNAARAYATSLSRFYKIMLSDTGYSHKYGKRFRSMYNVIDLDLDNFVYIKNIKPHTWSNIQHKNFFGFHVLEGDRLPSQQLQGINTSGVRCVFVPSEYVKNMFVLSGVNKPIIVIPHIIGNLYKPVRKRPFSIKINFLFAAAIYGLSKLDRKGLDIVLNVWKNFSRDKRLNLTIKIQTNFAKKANEELDRTFNLMDYLFELYGGPLPSNIKIIEGDVSDYEMLSIYGETDCILYPSRGEGFGLIPFEGLACGVPCIATEGLGMDEYLNVLEGGYLRIKTLGLIPGEKRYPYFDGSNQSNWVEPNQIDLIKQIESFLSHQKKIKKDALIASKVIWEKFNSKIIGTTLRDTIESYSMY
ncbi:glycosyltransferase [candidate division KSB1 bacterium]|nr:glycosyltransferase [candidate division KSB1 bacterium]